MESAAPTTTISYQRGSSSLIHRENSALAGATQQNNPRISEHNKRQSLLSLPLTHALDELQRVLRTHEIDTASLPLRIEADPVTLLRDVDELGPKSGDDELAALPVLHGRVADLAQHARDGGAVLRVEVRVDLVEEVEGRGVAALDREY